MKKYNITLDTGTTNTRVILWDKDKNRIASAKSEVGVRCTAIDGSNERLKAAVKGCLEQVLADAGTSWDEVETVVASGMITSNVGLVEIPHIAAPAGKNELAKALREVTLPEVCPLPIRFVPGVKNSSAPVTLENFEAMDIMRGEEVETVALLHQFPADREYLIVLPGSHNKFVATDREGRITGCLTSISGELLSALTNDTILADATGRKFVAPEEYDREMMLTGYRTAKETGIGRACFSCRILNQFALKDKMKLSNYLLGVALQSDVTGVLNSSALKVNRETEVIIAGKDPLRRALADIFAEEKCFARIHSVEPDGEKPLSALGALEIGAEACTV